MYNANELAINVDQYMGEILVAEYRSGLNKDLETLVFGNNTDLLNNIVKAIIKKFSICVDIKQATKLICDRAIYVAKDILEFEYNFKFDD